MPSFDHMQRLQHQASKHALKDLLFLINNNNNHINNNNNNTTNNSTSLHKNILTQDKKGEGNYVIKIQREGAIKENKS